MSLGAAIKTLREQRGLTQSQLAAAVGVSTRGVIRIEKGVTSLTVDVLGRYADALNVRPSELLRLSEVWSEVDPKP